MDRMSNGWNRQLAIVPKSFIKWEKKTEKDNGENRKRIMRSSFHRTTDRKTISTKLDIPLVKECFEAIDKFKRNKIAGPGGICAELVQNGGEELKDRIYKVIVNIWNREKNAYRI